MMGYTRKLDGLSRTSGVLIAVLIIMIVVSAVIISRPFKFGEYHFPHEWFISILLELCVHVIYFNNYAIQDVPAKAS